MLESMMQPQRRKGAANLAQNKRMMEIYKDLIHGGDGRIDEIESELGDSVLEELKSQRSRVGDFEAPLPNDADCDPRILLDLLNR